MLSPFDTFRDLSNSVKVRVASTANVTIASGLNAGDTIDGVVLVAGDLVLLKDQSTAADRGIYVVGEAPARYIDFSDASRGQISAYNMLAGSMIYVMEGTTNANTVWTCTSSPGGSLGSNSLAFAGLDADTIDGMHAAEFAHAFDFADNVYTPTGTAVVNVDAITTLQAIYQRNGSVVAVAGYVAIDPTAAAATFTQAGLSLPIASDLVNSLDLSGVLLSFNGLIAAIQGDGTNNRAMIEFNSNTTANVPCRYFYQYVIK